MSSYPDAATPKLRSGGFTLIETLIATGIMLTALVAVASIFAYSARTNLLTQQRTTATLLANSKIEALRAVSPVSSLTSGGNLVPASKVANYYEYVSITTTGAIVTSTTAGSNPYLRTWQIAGTNPKLITVAVFAERSGITGNEIELFRAATSVTNGF